MLIKKYFLGIFQSFSNTRFYDSVLSDWKGTGILYASFLSFIMAATIVLFLLLKYGSAVDNMVHKFIQQMPAEIVIENGELSISSPIPHVITLSDILEGEDQNIIDMFDEDKIRTLPLVIFKNSVSVEETIKFENIVLVGKKKMIIKDKDDTNVTFFTEYKNEKVVFTHETMSSLWLYLKYLFVPIGLGVIFVILLISMLFGAFILFLLSYIITRYMPYRMDAVTRFRTAIISYTPPFVTGKLFLFVIGTHISTAILIMIGLIYFYIIIKTCSSEKTIV